MKEQKIRLNPKDIEHIKAQFRKCFGPKDHLWIFGSRIYPDKRGGDIDLYIETLEKDVSEAFNNRSAFVVGLWGTIGEQKIDVVLNLLNKPKSLPIYEVARREGIKLI